MNDSRARLAAKNFVQNWTGRGYEKGESQPFWLQLLGEVLGVEHPAQFISFENQVMLDHTSFIDGTIESTHVLIEQKSLGKNLNQPIKQADGSVLTPFQQAKRYAAELPYSKRPRWIVTCNFAEFFIYDMEKPFGEPEIVYLKDLEKDYYRLEFLVEQGNEHIEKEMQVSIAAGEIVGKLYDALLAQYKDATKLESLQSLNMLCVRLVFCLYAEDAGIFGRRNMFHDYLAQYQAKDLRRALIALFKVLDEKPEQRDPYLEDELAVFPYVNGGLFENEELEIPQLTEEIRTLLLVNASEEFDWSEISPTIFGAVFESTLNPETRRSGGMHYTSIENIHKVIDPLFLDALRDEFAQIKELKQAATVEKRLRAFQEKLAGLTFLDPACGSGNFLTETYISLRRLENEVLKELLGAQIVLGTFANPIRVSISQFYGIEINDFAVTVAKTALWIAESQMMKATEDIVNMNLDFLPLKTNAYITEGNALRLDWESVVEKKQLDYIMGNPPFVGYSLQSKEQKADMLALYVDEKGKPYKTAGKIDYVAGWYFKAAQLMQGTAIRTAFVSTNSITQGEQVAGVWKPLYERFGVHIDFAHRTFRWDSEATLKAHVHCVIVGFSEAKNSAPRVIYDEGSVQRVENINAYLVEAENIFIEGRRTPLSESRILQNGGKPTEGGFLILTYDEMAELIKGNPLSEKFIRPYMMGKDFINRKPRYCLWLVKATPSELRKMPLVMKRIEAVREYRLKSPKLATQKKAETPMLFDEVRECSSNYIAIPKVSSENRKYIPIDYLAPEIIPGDKLFMLQDASLYDFGILTSNVHMAWMRAVAGRLKSDYSYSNTIVYNNFPWPTPTPAQKARIEQTAQAILDARALYPDSSLADLYDELTMPVELRRAHRANDKAVMEAYGFWGRLNSEAACVAELMKMYQALVEK